MLLIIAAGMATLLLLVFFTVKAYRAVPWMSQSWRVVLVPARLDEGRRERHVFVRLLPRFRSKTSSSTMIPIGKVRCMEDDFDDQLASLVAKAEARMGVIVATERQVKKIGR